MSFILVPMHGADLQINAWNWRPTLVLLRATGVLDAETYELMGCNGCGARADADLANRMAGEVERQLVVMFPGQRMLADLSVNSKPKSRDLNAPDIYSATYEWLIQFRDFCRRSKGFKVV